MQQDSIFTKIIKGDIPSYKIYETDQTYAFLDIHPIQPGHTLVVPKIQINNLWDLSDDVYDSLMRTSKKIAVHLQRVLKKRVGVQVMGLDVPHAHIHLIPFTVASEYRYVPNQEAEPNHNELKKIHQIAKIEGSNAA